MRQSYLIIVVFCLFAASSNTSLVPFQASYEVLNPWWMFWKPVNRLVYVSLESQKDELVLEYHIVLDDAEI